MILFLFFIFFTEMYSVKSFNSPSIPSIKEYFPEIQNDLTKIEWAHAVNSKNLLEIALNNPKVMMLEADVVLGTLKNDSNIIPIMAHPPSNTSDLSLNMFLKTVIKQSNKQKGVKLDFKSTESFEASFKILNFYYSKFTFPVFLNADILPGPVKSQTVPVDSDIFVMLSSKIFSKTTLSLGWTTRYGPNILGNYTQEQFNDMLNILKKHNVTQPVTLCLRAGLAAETEGIKNLVESIDKFQNSDNTTVTIWMSSTTDPVNMVKLRYLIYDLEKERVLLDLPHKLKTDLYLTRDSDQEVSKSFITAAEGAVVALLTSISTIFSNLF